MELLRKIAEFTNSIEDKREIQATLSWATLEFQVKVRSKYGCANVRL